VSALLVGWLLEVGLLAFALLALGFVVGWVLRGLR
jgi:hypothetical protein